MSQRVGHSVAKHIASMPFSLALCNIALYIVGLLINERIVVRMLVAIGSKAAVNATRSGSVTARLRALGGLFVGILGVPCGGVPFVGILGVLRDEGASGDDRGGRAVAARVVS